MKIISCSRRTFVYRKKSKYCVQRWRMKRLCWQFFPACLSWFTYTRCTVCTVYVQCVKYKLKVQFKLSELSVCMMFEVWLSEQHWPLETVNMQLHQSSVDIFLYIYCTGKEKPIHVCVIQLKNKPTHSFDPVLKALMKHPWPEETQPDSFFPSTISAAPLWANGTSLPNQ